MNIIAETKLSLRHVLRTVAPGLLTTYIRVKWDHEPEFSLLPALCDRNRISFDVGANWGQYASALRDFSAGVVACEPIPQLATFLRRSYRGAIRVEQVALSNANGQAEFLVEDDWSQSSLKGANIRKGQRRLAVQLKTLDSIAASPVGFIKIDVEGHEEEVIEGARQVIARDHPTLLIEIEERHSPGALARILARLAAQGYSGFFLQAGCLRDIAKFQPAEHQNPANYPYTGNSQHGHYINNFTFIHRSCLSEKKSRLAELGYVIVD